MFLLVISKRKLDFLDFVMMSKKKVLVVINGSFVSLLLEEAIAFFISKENHLKISLVNSDVDQ